jgi:hypothetical protein
MSILAIVVTCRVIKICVRIEINIITQQKRNVSRSSSLTGKDNGLDL